VYVCVNSKRILDTRFIVLCVCVCVCVCVLYTRMCVVYIIEYKFVCVCVCVCVCVLYKIVNEY